MESQYRKYMELAVEEARKCRSVPFMGQPKVGAVVVTKNGKVYSGHRGEIEGHPTDHAEFVVLRKKAITDDLSECIVFTTLEPCTDRSAHGGKQPCLIHILNAKPKKVYIGMTDPNPTIRGLGRLILEMNDIEVQSFDPDLSKRLRHMNLGFSYNFLQETTVLEKNKASDDAMRFKELNRYLLANVGKSIHRDVDEVPKFPLIARADWFPPCLVPLKTVGTELLEAPFLSKVDSATLSVAIDGSGDRYPASEWLKKKRPSAIFKDDTIFTLSGIKTDEGQVAFEVTKSTYFSYYDNLEGIALELSHTVAPNTGDIATPEITKLPLRQFFGDITTEFSKRSASIGMNCLTILKRRGVGRSEFLFHDRTKYGANQTTLAEANNVWHVVPAGSFQPSGEPELLSCNFYRGILREYAEELISEEAVQAAIQSGEDFLELEKVASLMSSIERGKSSLWWIGLGLDPVTTKPEALMLCVLDCEDLGVDETWDYFRSSWEGTVFSIAWDREKIEALLRSKKCLPAGAACLSRGLELWDEIAELLASG